MATGDLVFNKYKERLLYGLSHGASATLHCALLISVNPDVDTWLNWSAVMNHEALQTSGYSLMGQVIANPLITMDTSDDKGKWLGDDSTWSSSTITASGAVVYSWSTVTASCYLLAYWDFGGYQTSSSGDFTVQWATSGIINVT